MNITRDWRFIRDLRREVQGLIDSPDNDYSVETCVWEGLARVLLSSVFNLDGLNVDRLLTIASMFTSWGREWREWRDSQAPEEPPEEPPLAAIARGFVNIKNSL